MLRNSGKVTTNDYIKRRKQAYFLGGERETVSSNNHPGDSDESISQPVRSDVNGSGGPAKHTGTTRVPGAKRKGDKRSRAGSSAENDS